MRSENMPEDHEPGTDATEAGAAPGRNRAAARPWPAALVTATSAPPASPPSSSEGEGERWTIGRLLSWTTDFLKKRGSESPRLDSEVLLAHSLGRQRVQLYTHFEEEVAGPARAAFRDLVRRRAEGSPVAYLVGRKEFYSLPLKVTPAVLIPRPDSEFVVVEFIAAMKGVEAPRCVDVGTGSGCLALACAHEVKAATFLATDVSEEALAVARSNAETLGLSDRVSFRQGSLLEPVAAEGPFHAIVSNPPYIRTDIIPTLERGVKEFEPWTALDGGEDGLRVVAPLIEQAVPLRAPGGSLILEIGSDQEEPVRALIESRPELVLSPTVRDHANHPRVIRATRV
ncbi:MAG: peptide chain release factor N(5)-glutamine methyltransferase [Isosphaeraceae bacterium]